MSDSTLDQYNDLAGKVMLSDYPILPQPQWGQDVAYLAFVLDGGAKYRIANEGMRLPCTTCGGFRAVERPGEPIEPCPENDGNCDGFMSVQRAWNIVGRVLMAQPSEYADPADLLVVLRNIH